MKVWLVDHNCGLPAASTSEGRGVRQGVRTRLLSWFGRVARHPSARRGRPSGHGRNITVEWATSALRAGPYDLVLHFVPSATVGKPPVLGPYRAAARRLNNSQLANSLANTQRGLSGGLTVTAAVGRRRVPTLCLVVVLHDAQFSIERMRINKNVENLSMIAFHESAHNKDRSNSLHTAAGGGIFSDIHTGASGAATQPNRANISFFARRIWNWGPQYKVGGSLRPVTPP